ncbi:hypothetical protein [Hymenobacter sp. B81]|uniref:hypothetical protein n=1 Tax=Hymenobacter sp. B81 TaxID=3344878 RepID=UPI0037DCADBA
MPTDFDSWMAAATMVGQWLSSFGVLVPLALGIWRWRSLSGPARAVVWYFAFWTLEAFVDVWSRRVLHTNIYLYHVSVLVETWLLGWAYYRALSSPRLRRWFVPVGLVFTAVAVADATVLSGLDRSNQYARALQVVLMLGCALLYFEQWLHELRVREPWQDFMFLVSVGLSVYYAGSVMSYMVADSQTAANQLMHALALVINLSYLFALVLMTLGLWRDGRAGNDLRLKFTK